MPADTIKSPRSDHAGGADVGFLLGPLDQPFVEDQLNTFDGGRVRLAAGLRRLPGGGQPRGDPFEHLGRGEGESGGAGCFPLSSHASSCILQKLFGIKADDQVNWINFPLCALEKIAGFGIINQRAVSGSIPSEVFGHALGKHLAGNLGKSGGFHECRNFLKRWRRAVDPWLSRVDAGNAFSSPADAHQADHVTKNDVLES